MLSVLEVLAAGALSLTVRPVSQAVMVGEPVKLMLTWRSAAQISEVAIETEEFEVGSLAFLIGTGGSTREYREVPHSTGDRVIVAGKMAIGDVARRNLVLVAGASDGSVTVPFPSPGTYTLKARYAPRMAGTPPVESNEVTMSVRPLDVDGLAIRAALAHNPQLLLAGAPEVRGLLELYPGHPILGYSRLQIFRSRFHAVAMGVDPATGQLFSTESASREREIDLKLREIAQQMLTDETWGQFEEEALVIGMSAAVGRDAPLVALLRSRLRQRWPNSVATIERQGEL